MSNDPSGTNPKSVNPQRDALYRGVAMASLALIWFMLAPALFIMLYTVIDTQAAARAAIGENAKLAPYTISRLAHRLDGLQRQIDQKRIQLESAQRGFAEAEPKKVDFDGKVFAALRSLLVQLAPQLPADAKTPDCVDQQVCFLTVQQLNATRAGVTASDNIGQAIADVRRNMAEFSAAAADVNRFSEASTRLNREINTLELQISQTDYDDRPAQQAPPPQPDGAPQPTPGGGAALPPADSKDEKDASRKGAEDARAVALNYNVQRGNPLFEIFFFLPSGVVVAFFTSLMGAIGAAIYSLMLDLKRSVAEVKQGRDATSLWQTYGATPLLGGLAGFTVFFVVSAGATFLIQPTSAEAAQAVNQLSPPALASLGAFAGLVAERAMKWLIEKASGFFRLSSDPPAAPPPPVKPN